MYGYNTLELNDDETGSLTSKFLKRRTRKIKTPQCFLENGILTNLVRFAKTRRHGERNTRITSVCSKCNRGTADSVKCKRWAEDVDDNANITGYDLQPFCEILGSYLCSDCTLDRIKKNHLLHLPAIFDNCIKTASPTLLNISRPVKNSAIVSRALLDTYQPVPEDFDGYMARSNSPEFERFTYVPKRADENAVHGPLRLDIERLSMLPSFLHSRRQDFRHMRYQQNRDLKSRRTTLDLRTTLDSTLSSSFARYLVDVSPMKLIKRKKVKVPCNTPNPGVFIIDTKKPKPLDVILLAQRLEFVYRERYLPSNVFFPRIDHSLSSKDQISIKTPNENAEMKPGVNDEEDGFQFDYLAEDGVTDIESSYKNLLTYPPKVESKKAKEIQEENILL